MSEVSDTIQLIVISGKVMFLAGNLSLKAAILTAKTLDTIYLAKWKGSVSYARLRKIKGDEVQFLNVSTEEKKILHAIEKEMKQHGILYARLPDLCGGDNRTQYVISPSDMVKCRAFLLDHFSGKYGKIKAGPIRPADYIQTGSGEAQQLTDALQDFFAEPSNGKSERNAGGQQPEDLQRIWKLLPEETRKILVQRDRELTGKAGKHPEAEPQKSQLQKPRKPATWADREREQEQQKRR